MVTDLSHQSRRALPRDWSPAKSLSTKTVILSTCFCRRNLSAALGFPNKYLAARLNWKKSNSQGSLILWAKCFAVSARSNLSWAKYESLMQADMYRVASSFFRIGPRLPSNTSLSCSFSRGVVTASVFVLHPDSLMTSGACLKSGFNIQVLPSLIKSNSEYTIQQHKAFHV